VPKGTRRVTEFDDMVIGLYAKGLTTRDIAEWLAQTYGAKISHETVANITDSVTELVKTWRSRPLDEVGRVALIDPGRRCSFGCARDRAYRQSASSANATRIRSWIGRSPVIW